MFASDQEEKRIVVEIFSHEEAERLREEMRQMDDRHRSDIRSLESRMQALHRTVYECMELITQLRNNR